MADLASFGVSQAAGDTVPCGTVPSVVVDGNHRIKDAQAWTSVMEALHAGMASAVREQAGQITQQARSQADAILAQARQQAEDTAAACTEMARAAEKDRAETGRLLAVARQQAERLKAACAELVAKAEQDRGEAAELLAETRLARSEAVKIHESARRGPRDMRTDVQEESLLTIEDVWEGAAPPRGTVQRQGGVPNRAGSERGIRAYRRGSLTECAIEPLKYASAFLAHSTVEPARELPWAAGPEPRALEGLRQVIALGRVVLIIEGCSTDLGIWLRMQEHGERDGTGPEGWRETWQVLKMGTEASDAPSTSADRSDHTSGIAPRARQQDGYRFVIGVVEAEDEDTDSDAKLDVEGVGNCAGR